MLPVLAGIAAAAGVADTVMGIAGANAQNQAEDQAYRDQLAFHDANTRFARWQARFTKEVSDAEGQYQFWQQTVNHNQQVAYSRSLQNYELLKAIAQADVVRDTRAGAGAQFVRSSEAIGQAAAEAAMQDAVAFQQYQVAAIKARGRARASEQEGGSIDRLIADYARQAGDYQAIQQINEGFRQRQYTREQAGAVAEYLSRYNSQPFYETQPQMEPIAPFAPLPALLTPPAPSMVGAGPSQAAQVLRFGTAITDGIKTGLGTYSSLSKLSS